VGLLWTLVSSFELLFCNFYFLTAIYVGCISILFLILTLLPFQLHDLLRIGTSVSTSAFFLLYECRKTNHGVSCNLMFLNVHYLENKLLNGFLQLL